MAQPNVVLLGGVNGNPIPIGVAAGAVAPAQNQGRTWCQLTTSDERWTLAQKYLLILATLIVAFAVPLIIFGLPLGLGAGGACLGGTVTVINRNQMFVYTGHDTENMEAYLCTVAMKICITTTMFFLFRNWFPKAT